MRYFLPLGYIFSLLLFASCSSEAEKIEVSELKTVCDYVNALDLLTDEIIEELDGRDLQKELRHDKGNLKKLYLKMDQIHEEMQEKYNFRDYRHCDKYQVVIDKMHSID